MEPTYATWQRVVTIPLGELSPFRGNARRGNPELILSSLRRNGQYRSLVTRAGPDGQLTVLAGNHTLMALRKHGVGPCDYQPRGIDHRPCGICGGEDWTPSARCEVITCDDDTARRINLVDNRSADIGEYDNDALAELLSYLDDDYEGTGYTDADVTALITPPEETLPLQGDAETDETEPVWGVIIECDNEAEQVELLETLTGEGRRARALMA